jgi:hypothetical protein
MSNEQKNYSPWLQDYTKQYINKDYPPIPRVVVAAACRNHTLDILLVGSRHWSQAMHGQLNAMDFDTCSSEFEEGFIDQYDQFMGRIEAKRVAIKNGQKLQEADWGEELYSENLY